MCRATVQLQDCTSMFETNMSLAGDIVKETKNLFSQLMSSNEPRILVVSGPSTMLCPSHLLMRCDIDHLVMLGNMSSLEKRCVEFSSGAKKVAIIVYERMKCIPIRLHYVSHVVFLGTPPDDQISHWTTRAVNPLSTQKPICYTIESGYDYICTTFKKARLNAVLLHHGY